MEQPVLEKRNHSTVSVPYSYYKSKIPDYFTNLPLHWHSEWEITYILSGSSEFLCGDQRFLTGEGDIVLTPANLPHAVYPYRGQRQDYDTLVFSTELLGISGNDRCTLEVLRPMLNTRFQAIHITPEHPGYPEFQRAIQQVMACARQNTAKADLLLKSEMLRLCYLLADSSELLLPLSASASHMEALRPALAYIQEHIQEPISIETLAATVHLSKSWFMGSFRRNVGMSALEYIHQLRIKTACELLLGTNKTALEIASEVGFRNISNFNRCFRQLMGCTPREYRRKQNAPSE